MVDGRAMRIFVLGSFRDLQGSGVHALGVLARLCEGLRECGWDAFMSGDRRSLELAGGSLPPRALTEALEPRADLALYVACLDGRGDGWVSELTAMQIKDPRGSTKRALLLEERYPLTSILDPAQHGYLADPPVLVTTWANERQLLATAIGLATHMNWHGRLP